MIRVNVRDDIHHFTRRGIQEVHPKDIIGGMLPEDWCILVDDVGDWLVDDDDNILVALCAA